jgi:hypothetical protein
MKRAVHPAVAWLPMGIPQYLEGRPVAATLLLVSQALLLATNITSYALVARDRAADGYYNHPAQSEALRWVNNWAFGLLLADVAAGAIDGVVHRDD